MNPELDKVERIARIWEDVEKWGDAKGGGGGGTGGADMKQELLMNIRTDFVCEVEAEFRKSVYDMFDFMWAKLNDAHRAQLNAVTHGLVGTWHRIAKQFKQPAFGKHLLALIKALVHAIDALHNLAHQSVPVSMTFLKTIATEEMLNNEGQLDRAVAVKRAEVAKDGGGSTEKLAAFDMFIVSLRDAFDKIDAVGIHFNQLAPQITAKVAAKAISKFVFDVLHQAILLYFATLDIGSMEFYTRMLMDVPTHDRDRARKYEEKIDEEEECVMQKEIEARVIRDELAAHMAAVGRSLAQKYEKMQREKGAMPAVVLIVEEKSSSNNNNDDDDNDDDDGSSDEKEKKAEQKKKEEEDEDE